MFPLLLHRDYGKLLNVEAMRHDPFYALHELLEAGFGLTHSLSERQSFFGVAGNMLG
jgi:hypothetical protein